MSLICNYIEELVQYGMRTGLLDPSEEIYARNLLLDLFGETEYTDPDTVRSEAELADILEPMLEIAVQKGLTGDSLTEKDLFDTRIMNCLTPRPAEVIRVFREQYRKSPADATDWYYRFSQDTNYIRRDRAKKDVSWQVDSPYGRIDITINLAKPEKDPKDIAAAGKKKASGYPACLLCRENEGYAGHAGHPARQTHRLIPVSVGGEAWSMQYSPYGYYNEHCIFLSNEHRPMAIDASCFRKLLDIIRFLPHYFVGSNADLPIVGGSILSHEHFQGGRYTFAMEKAPIAIPYRIKGFEDVESGIVCWPLSVFRIRSADPERLVQLADRILTVWRGYTDEESGILARTDGEPHNTITPIARMRDGLYEIDLALRNNLTTPERPLGLYHPSEKYHHIKKENIGLIEVMGLAILPSRLKTEMGHLQKLIADGRAEGAPDSRIVEQIRSREDLCKHADWAGEILERHPETGPDELEEVLRKEIGNVFVHVLEDAGVYKWTPEGHRGFLHFLEEAGKA